MKVRLLRDSIAFKFVQNTRNGHFSNETDWGFQIAGIDDDFRKTRWGIVEMIGPDVTEVKKGDYILVDSLKWTNAVTLDGEKYWRTIQEHVLIKTDKKPSDLI